jgi:hypothetical protein
LLVVVHASDHEFRKPPSQRDSLEH